jgi:hypothetical protein
MALNMYPTAGIIAGHSATRTLALVMSGIALMACGSDDRAKPGNTISLTFTGKSKSEYFFVLENPTSHAIFFRGTKRLWFAPMPVDTGFSCTNAKTGEGMVGGFPLFDSVTGGKDPPPIEVSPGKAIRLRVGDFDLVGRKGNDFNFPGYKGQTCKLHLLLWLPGMQHPFGEIVESQVFQS